MDDLIAFLRARLDDTNTGLHTVECGWHQREFGHEGIDCTCGAPERLLAEVDAKRRIIADYERYVAERRRMMGGWYDDGASPILKYLALPDAGHPDYRAEWRP